MIDIVENECKDIIKKIDFSSLNNKKILITGASGLIGIYIASCLQLLDQNLDIYCWINSDMDPKINHFFKNVTIIKGDISSEDFLNETKQKYSLQNKFDIIIHSAGYAQPTKFLLNKIKTININTLSTIKLFEMLSDNGKFVFLSSSEVYSGNNKQDILEEDCGLTNPSHPRAAYIESKRCGEAICNSIAESTNIDVKILRLSLAYGPGTKKDDLRVVNTLIQKALLEEKIILLDNGLAIRTYAYISDIIEMFWNIILFGNDITYNLTGINKATILHLANIIGKKLNKQVVQSTDSGLSGNPQNVSLSIKKYTKEFGYKEFITLEDGISRTIEWQKYIYDTK